MKENMRKMKKKKSFFTLLALHALRKSAREESIMV